jgi:hypothetical protein
MSLFLFLGCKEATETVALDEVTFEKEQVAFVNYSTEFIREDPVENINFYYYEAKPGLPYVDISEFVNLLLGIIDENTEVEINANSVRVWNEYFYTDEEKADYGITEDSIIAYVTFDFLTETVTAPNVDTFDYFSGETETDFSEGLNMVSYTEEELPELSINVADYGFMFFTVEDTDVVKYTIPLSLAGLFLTGSMFDVVHNGDTLYGIDTYQLGDLSNSTSDVYDAVRLNNDLTPAMELESRRFLELAFDYFYGLKAYKSITSFKTYTNTYFNNAPSFEYAFSEFADSFADLHTGIISYGHQNPGYDHENVAQFIYDYSYEFYGCECNLYRTNFDLSFHEDMAYLRITEFNTDFKADLEPKMEEIRTANPEYVVIDLACNGGGVLAGVFHLLNYITNEDISLYTTTLGAKSSSTYDVEGDKAIDAKWYFITSGATYSAANLVTAMAKELDLVETIGARSGGGACSVKALVLPNGAVMQMSSNMNLSYSDYSTVEEGVDTDYPIDFYSAGMRYYNTGVRARYPDEETFYGIILEMNEEEPAE